MNKIYKLVWSKVRSAWVVTSEIAKGHGKAVSSRQRKSIAAVMAVLALGFIPGAAYAAIDGVTTFVEAGNQNVKIGNGISLRNNVPENGAVAIGDHAEIDDYVMQEGSIAIGKNAFVENMWGFQDKTFRFGMVTPDGDERTDPYLPAGIAIGQNTYARSGGIMLGDHKYIGKLGDTTVDSTTAEKKRRLAVLVGATTLGLNSYSAGAFATTTGAYSIMSNAYDGNTNQLSGSQNFGAVINGSFNSIESKTSGNSSSGVANAVVGTANRTFNANGALVFGAGNEIENSVGTISGIDMFMGGGDSAKDFADTLRKTVKSSNGGGAVLAIGGGNKANYAKASQLMGVNNTLTGTENTASDYNLLNGFKNVGTNISHVSVIGAENQITDTKSAVVFGNKRKLMKADGSIVLGSADDTTETNVKDAVIIGHNANTTVAGGVALGSRSVADRGKADAEKVYLHENDDVKATVKGDLAAISVGNADETRQITGVAAGTKDTDAVNVAQLKAMTGGGSATSVHFFSVKASESSKNYQNDGAKENGAIAIGANAAAEKSGSVAMGFNTTAGGSGSIAIGDSAQILANEANRGDGKGTGTIIIGNESADAGGTKDHAASDDTLIGSLNSVGESNGVFVRGTGNIVTNAYHYEDLTQEDMQKFMGFFEQGKPAGEYFEKTGSHISVNGDGNYVDNALYSQISGVNNKLTGTDTLPAEYNIITGNRNTLENASNNIVTGDKYKLAGVKHAVIIGSSDEEKEVKVSDIVMVGHNANTTVASGVALGSDSVADRAGFTKEKKGVFSDVDLNGKTDGAVSVGTKDKLRQIINVGDATEDTDAVNLRQLRALSTKVDKGGVHYFSVNSKETGEGSNYKNDGAKAKGSIVLGVRSSSEGINGVVVGNDNKLTGTKNDQNNSVVIGTGLNVDGVHNIVVGTNYENYDQNATKVKGEHNTVIGNGNLVGYTAVQDPNDATKWKYTEVSTSGSDRNVAVGSGNTANGSSVAVGTSLEVENLGRAFGSGNKVIGSNNGGGQWGLALGSNNTVKGEMAVSVGTETNALGDYTVSIGSEAKTNASQSIAMGYQAETEKGWSAAIGSGAKTTGTASTAVGGLSASATVDYGAAFGSYSVAQRASGVAGYLANGQDGLAWKSNLGAFSVGDDVEGYSRQITGVAAGTKDTDAVNVAQLKALNTKMAQGAVHYYSVTSDKKAAGSNFDNDGAKADDSMVIGIGSTSEGINSTVIGNNNKLTGNKSIKRAGKVVTVNNSIVAGQNLEVDGYSNTVFATESVYDMYQRQTKVAGDHNTVIGAGNLVGYSEEDNRTYTKLGPDISSNKNVVIGTRQTVSGSENVALGYLTEFEVGADQVTTLGIENRIGSEAREGVAIGNHLGINGPQTIAIGFASEANAKSAIAFGSESFANAENSVAIGYSSVAEAEDGVALGSMSFADREAGRAGYLSNGKTTAEWQATLGAVSVGGVYPKLSATRQITGVAAGTEDTDAVNVAQLKAVEGKITQTGTEAQKHTSVTEGTNISVVQDGLNAAGGKNYKVSLAENIDLGQNGSIKAGNTTINNDGLTVQGGPSVTTDGIDAGKNVIANVAAGTKDTDAVNVSQLKAVQEIAAAKTTIEAGDNIKVEKGSAKGSYKISATDTTLQKGNNALSLNGSKLNLSVKDTKGNEVTGSVDLEDLKGAVNTDTTYTLESEENDNNTTTIFLKGSDKKEQQVIVATKDTRNTIVDSDTVTVEAKAQEDGSNEYKLNVKTDGKVAKDNKGIVTGGTVYNETRIEKDGNYIKAGNTAGQNLIALDKQVGANTTNIAELNNRVYDMGNRVDRVGAGAAALAALHPLDFDPDDKWDFAAGYGNYKGAHALAIGAFYRPNESKMFSVGGSFGGGENMLNIGFSMKVGRGNEYMKLSRSEMAQQLDAQAQKLDEQAQKLDAQTQKLDAQDEQIRDMQAEMKAITQKLATLQAQSGK